MKTDTLQPHFRWLASPLRIGFFVLLLTAALLTGLVLSPRPVAAQEAQAAIPGCQVNTAWQIYIVAGGDTLAKIARRYNASINALIIGNCLSDPNRILVGQQLRVPGTPAPGGTQITVGATIQYFERGWMIWRGDTGLITVYYGTGTTGNYENYPIWSYALLSDNPVTTIPPKNLYKPIFGFGKVWGNYANVRNGLGWARGPEQGFAALYINQPPLLFVTLPNGQRVQMLNGGWTYYYDNTTPTPSVVTYQIASTYQPFERGFMVWLSSIGEIYAFYGNTPSDGSNGGAGTFAVFTSESYGNLPSNPMSQTPPVGLVQPIMGFGKVWWNYPTTRSRLGWGLTSEVSYTANMRVENGIPTSMTAPDGRLISLNGGGWSMPRISQTAQLPTATAPAPVGTAVPSAVLYVNVTAIQPDAINLRIDWEVFNGDMAALEIYNHATDASPTNVLSSLAPVGAQQINLPGDLAGGSARIVVRGYVHGVMLTSQEVIVPLVAGPQATATPTAFGVELRQFTVDLTGITDSGIMFNAAWDAAGVDSIELHWYQSLTEARPTGTFTQLPLKGSTLVIAPSDLVGTPMLFQLWGFRGGTVVLQQELTITVPAPSGSTSTPAPTDAGSTSVTTQAAYQTYQGGFMLWRADTGEIDVFYEGVGRVEGYSLAYYQGFAENPVTDTPPDGLIKPINGFGKVWGNVEIVRVGLNWATTAEQAYLLTITAEYDAGGSVRYLYTLPDGRTVEAVNGKWGYRN